MLVLNGKRHTDKYLSYFCLRALFLASDTHLEVNQIFVYKVKMSKSTTSIYAEILARLDEEEMEVGYREQEMEKISRKISNFLQSLEPASVKTASTKIALLIYTYFWEQHGKISGIPYKGKCDRDTPTLDFDLKNLPPPLARIISLWIDSAFD